jgi:hypothetical protein
MKARLVQSEFVRSISTDGKKAKSYIKHFEYENGVQAIDFTSYFFAEKEYEVGYINREGQVVKNFKEKSLTKRQITFQVDTINELINKLQDAHLRSARTD